jgi:hypothetical protein
MGDYYHDYLNKDLAESGLDALMDAIRASQKGTASRRAGFDNDSVVWMIKLWTKTTALRLGLRQEEWIYYRFKREASKLAAKQKRSDVLWSALSVFQLNLGNLDYYHRAREAMFNFVWDYHWRISDVDQNTDFMSKINLMLSAGLEGLANDAFFPAESQA